MAVELKDAADRYELLEKEDRAELALAKEQARISNATVLKAAEELRAEQAAHR